MNTSNKPFIAELPDFSLASVLVVGDLMLDRYWTGETQRISPEAPIPVVKVEEVEDRVGGAGNVALNIASLGGSATLLAITGNDESADILNEKLHAADVKCCFEKHDEIPTITKLRVMSRHQQMLRLDFEQPLNKPSALKALSKQFKTLISEHNFGAIVFSDYAKGSLDNISELIALAKQKNIPCLVDPKGSDFSKYKGATILTPNRTEFEEVVGKCESEDEIATKAQVLIKEYHLSSLLLTRSEEGMSIFNENNSQHFPAKATEVFDVTGAGDTVIATLAASLACGCEISNAVLLANNAASIVVAKSGTAAIALHELKASLSQENGSGKGIVKPEQLKHLVTSTQKTSQKIVMTNGCFDIIHAGHISYLEEAKRLGNKLIVAVNSDDSVKRLKGEARPINTLERRMQVLAGLEAVDWVVSFEEDTPADLVEFILPDILVKGGDWKIEEIAGGEAVVANGGKVMSLSFKEGHSTTAIIDLIKEREQA
jgi:D-beta-D-heptose 7-phosphate kinase/D-beta-D-heptose 1-phosphate adenosyltransferase